ncbi:response regulator, partial [bacterium]|nr:response regulator [bacterium]
AFKLDEEGAMVNGAGFRLDPEIIIPTTVVDISIAEDGLVTARQIVKEMGASRPRIVAMTANVKAKDKEECLKAGMDDFVAKPIVLSALISAIYRCKDGLELPEVKIPKSQAPYLNEVEIREQYGDMFETFDEISLIFINELPPRIEGLHEAVLNNDALSIENKCHSLRGILRNLYLEKAAEELYCLETMGELKNLSNAANQLVICENSLKRSIEMLKTYLRVHRQEI